MLRLTKWVQIWFASILVAHVGAMTLSAEQRPPGILPGAKVYIAPVDDFDLFLKAAIRIKEVPVVVVTDRGVADCEITVPSRTEKAGRASIQVVDLRSSGVVFTYEGVWKQDKQDLVMDFAKQLKKRVEQDERLARKNLGAKPTPKPEVKVASRSQSKIVAEETPRQSVQSEPNAARQTAAELAVVVAQPRAGSEPAPPVASVEGTPTDRAAQESAGAANATGAAKDSATTPTPVQIVCPEGIRQIPFASSRPDRKTPPCAEPVTIVGGRPPWIRVRTRDGIEGSVSSHFLEKR
jgi:hypothetical protein